MAEIIAPCKRRKTIDKEDRLTADDLRRALDYDPETGVFRCKIARGPHPVGSVAGGARDDGYIRIAINERRYFAHRLAWLYVRGEWPAGELDHKDNVRDHNWIDNLRPANRTQNNANKSLSPKNKSGFKGVSLTKSGRAWQAQIQFDRKRIFLGIHRSAEEAHSAYLAAADLLFGEFARAA